MENEDIIPFRQILRLERFKRAWTQDRLAEEIGVDAKTIRRWESGTSLPRTYYRKKLSSIFGSDFDELLDVTQNKNNSIVRGLPRTFILRCSLSRHLNTINQIVWSLDGSILASSSSDKTIYLWNPHNGQKIQVLTGHTGAVHSIAWSPDGHMLASGSEDHTIRLWNIQAGQCIRTLTGHIGPVYSVAWSPDGQILVSGSEDRSIQVWDVQTGLCIQILRGHNGPVYSIAWSPNGQVLASSSEDQSIRLWNIQAGQCIRTLTGHIGPVYSVAWSPDGQILASGSEDHTIRLWDARTGSCLSVLEQHTEAVTNLSFYHDGSLFTSKSVNSINLWRRDNLQLAATINLYLERSQFSGHAFHPNAPILATVLKEDGTIQIFDLDIKSLLSGSLAPKSIYYTNAKVVLIGDSGVGKSGLGLALTNQPFAPTYSTHGRDVWTFEEKKVRLSDGRTVIRETLLWDLAGQPGYRLTHQLHLNEIVVALLICDSHSETDPFSGIHHWVRALKTAQRIQGESALLTKKFLVIARIDRGGKSVSSERINSLLQDLEIDDYFETSAKEGFNISLLSDAIKKVIEWEKLPLITSTYLFQRIKSFLIKEKEAGRLLSTSDDLYRAFMWIEKNQEDDLSDEFNTCIKLLEAKGIIKQLSFGSFVLLQPELLDTYASALVNAVRDEPDGLGSISEELVRRGDFFIPKEERLIDKDKEKLLLIAIIEDLLRYEIALREQGDDGPYLVFPSQSTRENPDLPNLDGRSVVFYFEGPVLNIYTTLAVRLSHTGLFMKKELWKNAIVYTTRLGGIYGIFLNNIGEGRAELTLFFNKLAHEETCFHFEEYIKTHLERRALTETIQRKRIFTCPTCSLPLSDLHVKERSRRGFNWMICGVCDTKISLLEKSSTTNITSRVPELNYIADTQRERSAAVSTLQGKIVTEDFDVFLCHNDIDLPRIKEIGEKLKEAGILPWLSEWELRPGLSWQRLLEKQIEQIKAAAVFVGKEGIGPWQQHEMQAFLREFVKRDYPVIPVLLIDTPEQPPLPLFLEGLTWVDFRKQDPDPIKQLIWGITGKRSI